METILARGMIRETASLLRDGVDLEAAIAQTTCGTSRAVKSAYLKLIAAAARQHKAQTPAELVRNAVLTAAARL